jgi:NADH:ubiquinone oxidoreductase subunit 5 (subunit L)/multisubunit Na+/H+ antiporter MnhA subunit
VNGAFIWLLSIGSVALAIVIFAMLTTACEIGFFVGRWRSRRAPPDDHDQAMVGTLSAGMLSLLAFILGLSVSYAQGRFEARRDLVVTEANAVGTAWLRARALASPEGDAVAAGIRKYAATRLAFTIAERDGPVEALNEQTAEEEAVIWAHVREAARLQPSPITATMINAVNEMIDSAQSQRFAFLGDPPGAMFDMMIAGSLLAIGALGYEMGLRGRRQLVLTCLLLLMWTGAIVITFDLSRPRIGEARPDPRPLEWTIHDIDTWGRGQLASPQP